MLVDASGTAANYPNIRVRVSVERHFVDGQAYYAPPHLPLARVHVLPVTTDLDFVVDYSAKGLRSRRFDHDDSVLILPRSASELRKASCDMNPPGFRSIGTLDTISAR
jgi:hypothetical protein